MTSFPFAPVCSQTHAAMASTYTFVVYDKEIGPKKKGLVDESCSTVALKNSAKSF